MNSLQPSSRVGATTNVTPQKASSVGQRNLLSPKDGNDKRDNTSSNKDAANNVLNNGNVMTQVGELVYQRMAIDFKSMNKQ